MLHQGHDRLDDISVLLVGGEVQHHVGFGHHFFVGANLKARLGSLRPGRTLLLNGLFAERIGHIQTAISEVEALIKALSAAADDHQFFAGQWLDTRCKFGGIHKPALAQLLKLCAEREGVKVVTHWRVLNWGPKKGCVLCRTSCSG